MKTGFEHNRIGLLAIAAAGIFAAGAVAERANLLYGTTPSSEPLAAEESAVTAAAGKRPAAPHSGESRRP